MSYKNHSDREFLDMPKEWGAFLPSNRITKPILKKDTLNEIIKPGYVGKLETEGGFDWSCFIEYERLLEERIERSKLGKEEFYRKNAQSI